MQHFSYSDQEYLSLQCLNPCIVQQLPNNSPLVHLIASYLRYCMLIGLTCVSVAQLNYLKTVVIPDYQKRCAVRPQSALLVPQLIHICRPQRKSMENPLHS